MTILFVAAPDGADPALALWFRSLQVPNGFQTQSCCSMADCRNAVERIAEVRHQVFIDKKTFGADAPDAWVTVPEGAILRGKDNPTGRPVVCWSQGRILCYVPGPDA